MQKDTVGKKIASSTNYNDQTGCWHAEECN